MKEKDVSFFPRFCTVSFFYSLYFYHPFYGRMLVLHYQIAQFSDPIPTSRTRKNLKDSAKTHELHAFFTLKNQFKLSAEAGLFLIFWRFQPQIVLKLFLFPDIFIYSGLVARNNRCKIALKICLLLFHSAKKLEVVNTASVNVTSLLVTLPVPNDQAKF